MITVGVQFHPAADVETEPHNTIPTVHILYSLVSYVTTPILRPASFLPRL